MPVHWLPVPHRKQRHEADCLVSCVAMVLEYMERPTDIAFVNTACLSYWPEATRHAVVVVGLDAERVYLNDPFFDAAPQYTSRLEFELAWDEFDNAYAVLGVP